MPDRMAVNRDECRTHGHTFEHVLAYATLAPQQIVCSRCGASWRIHPDDVERDF